MEVGWRKRCDKQQKLFTLFHICRKQVGGECVCVCMCGNWMSCASQVHFFWQVLNGYHFWMCNNVEMISKIIIFFHTILLLRFLFALSYSNLPSSVYQKISDTDFGWLEQVIFIQLFVYCRLHICFNSRTETSLFPIFIEH